ncbi:hypothetical protein WICPIJ_007004, partial [Wickerhamomyces pijperi]
AGRGTAPENIAKKLLRSSRFDDVDVEVEKNSSENLIPVKATILQEPQFNKFQPN